LYTDALVHRFQPKPFRFRECAAWRLSSQRTRSIRPSPCRIVSSSGPANRWTPLSSRPCLPYVRDVANGRAPSLHGHYSASSLLRTQPPPSRLRPISRCRRLYDLPCSGDFAPGRGGLLQLPSMSLSPCCRFHPAEVINRIGQCSVAHAAFAPAWRARPSGSHFRGHIAFSFDTAR
jgi:hypothetical protein